jgi:UDP-glucose 4-epimerase
VRPLLVTGGAGYIGSHTAKALRRAGRTVVLFDDLSAGHAAAALGADLVEGDVRDTTAVAAALRACDAGAVLHFAAWLSVGESVRDPLGYYRNNVGGALSVLEAMVAEQVPYFVFSSTAAVYGEPIDTPITETHPTVPINPYGQTKLAVEHDPELHLIPRAVEAARGGPPLEVFGQDYGTPDGTCLRDYVHVTDLADAHVRALDALERGGPSGVFNLGNGRPFSVKEVIAAVERASGRPVPWRGAPRRAGDPAVLYASNARARAALGWEPRYEDLDTIVRTAWRWRDTHPRGFDTGRER